MNVIVFYFSGTGNTKWAAETLQKTLLGAGHGCRLCFIDRQCSALEAIRDADIIGFAFPVYGANMPAAVRGFIEGLPAGIEKPAFIVTTAGYVDPFGPFAARKALQDRFRLTGYINLKMSNNVSVPTMRLTLLPIEKLKKRMARAERKIKKLVDRMVHHTQYIRNIGPYLLPGIFIRRATEQGQRDNYRSLSVDTARCTQCLVCVNQCPTQSIVFSDGAFRFLPSCTACFRCYNLCPAAAVCHKGQYADPDVFPRYKGPPIT